MQPAIVALIIVVMRRNVDPPPAFPGPGKDIAYCYFPGASVLDPYRLLQAERRGRPATLADCVKGDTRIVAFCKGCGREAPVDVQMLAQKLGPDFRPGAVIKRFSAALRCRECHLRGARVEFKHAARSSGTRFDHLMPARRDV